MEKPMKIVRSAATFAGAAPISDEESLADPPSETYWQLQHPARPAHEEHHDAPHLRGDAAYLSMELALHLQR
jgi:hypothetical protein